MRSQVDDLARHLLGLDLLADRRRSGSVEDAERRVPRRARDPIRHLRGRVPAVRRPARPADIAAGADHCRAAVAQGGVEVRHLERQLAGPDDEEGGHRGGRVCDLTGATGARARSLIRTRAAGSLAGRIRAVARSRSRDGRPDGREDLGRLSAHEEQADQERRDDEDPRADQGVASIRECVHAGTLRSGTVTRER